MNGTYPLTSLEAVKAPGRYAMVGGPFGSKLVSRDYVPEGVPVIRGGNLSSDARFSFSDLVFVTEEKVAADLFRNLAFPGDIVVTQRGTLGQVGLIPDDSPYRRFVVSQSQMKLTVDRSKADPLFVYYALRSPVGQHEIHSRAMTAGVPHINLSLFQQLRVPLPPLGIQQKIATILSVYDDQIENNNRRIKILEEMARRIYHEWFVEFRYPGHEAVPLVESRAGLIPQGWAASNLGSVGRWRSGGTPPTGTPEFWGGGIPWITSGCLLGQYLSRSDRTLTAAGVANGSRLVARDAVLFVVRGMSLANEFRVGIAEREVAFGQDCKAIEPDAAIAPLLVLHYLLDRAEQIAKMVEFAAHGTGKLATDRLQALPFPVPPLPVQAAFVNVADRVRRTIASLHAMSHNLRASRDLLIPRLIAGDIDVTDVDIEVPDLAA